MTSHRRCDVKTSVEQAVLMERRQTGSRGSKRARSLHMEQIEADLQTGWSKIEHPDVQI